MLKVALTGGIATGKSYVLARFEASGIPTIDADALVHAALAAGSPAVPKIAERFGTEVLAADRSVDRRRLGELVFTDARARQDLEAILHPDVYRRIHDWFRSLVDGPCAFALADIPLLFETKHEADFDRVIVTACSPDVQIARLKQRNGLSDAEARARLQAQLPIDEKVRRAHYVIDTSGTFAQTDAQVDGVIQSLSR